jgi:hypothetical protein
MDSSTRRPTDHMAGMEGHGMESECRVEGLSPVEPTGVRQLVLSLSTVGIPSIDIYNLAQERATLHQSMTKVSQPSLIRWKVLVPLALGRSHAGGGDWDSVTSPKHGPTYTPALPPLHATQLSRMCIRSLCLVSWSVSTHARKQSIYLYEFPPLMIVMHHPL